MADLDMASLDFRTILSDVDKGLVVKPILRNYLHGGEWTDKFSIDFDAGADVRAPDGWFHPSTHPLVPARALYYYLTEPHRLITSPMAYGNVLSVTMGKAMHGLVQFILTEARYLVPKEPGGCWCSWPRCDEWGFADEETRSRGHVDGIGQPPEADREIFEFKTASELSAKVRKADDMDLDWFKASWPGYYAQQQDYLRMSGFRQSRVVFFTLGYPWEMKEFVIPYDRQFAYAVAEKYRRVLQAAADQRPPAQCCGGEKTCPSRGLCLR